MSTSRPQPDWLAVLEASTEQFAALVESADHDAPVVACPGWTLHDLTDHLGGVHQWAAHAVVAGNPRFEPDPAPGGAELAPWYRQHARALIDVLRERGPESPAWSMEPGNATAGFWRRRQVHEVAVHLWDAEQALGPTTPMDPEIAWDGVLEVVDVMYPRQVRLERIAPLTASVQLVADDVTARTTIGDGERVDVRAPAEVLLRLLWHRATPDEEEGIDPRAVSVLAGPVTP